MDSLKIGFDTVSVTRIGESIVRWGERFIERLFTPSEQAYCDAGQAEVRVSRYAVRFAAKEAFVKAWDLFYWNEPPPLTGICFSNLEVRLDPWGRPALALLGDLAATFAGLGFVVQSVSLSHDGVNACAVVSVVKR